MDRRGPHRHDLRRRRSLPGKTRRARRRGRQPVATAALVGVSVFAEQSDLQGTQVLDMLVVGGGINGVGIARDAAGRGLSVRLVEKGDLAAATSSASSKLMHGGLRYCCPTPEACAALRL